MTDAFGQRAVFSVVLPATNTIVEPDMATVCPSGVSNQTFRFLFPGRPDSLEDLMDWMRPTLALSLDCEPDRIVVGYTTEFLSDGITAAARLRTFVEGSVDRPTTMASDAVPEALKTLGIKRIGVVTPYQPNVNRNVEAYFTALDFSVADVVGLYNPLKGLVDTARISASNVRDAFVRVDRTDVEALVQIGTNLACAGLVEEMEACHHKPVVAVNTATYWMALRSHGIADHLDGHGMLLADH